MKNNYKFWIVLSIIIVFAAGIFGGILLDKHVLDKKQKRPSRRGQSTHFPTLEMMAEELSLTQDQQGQIREIFNDTDQKLRDLRRQINKQFSSVRSQLKDEIKNVLTDEQGKKFEAMIEKYVSQRRKEMEERKRHSKKNRKDKRESR